MTLRTVIFSPSEEDLDEKDRRAIRGIKDMENPKYNSEKINEGLKLFEKTSSRRYSLNK